MTNYTSFGGTVIVTHSHGLYRTMLVQVGEHQIFVSTPMDEHSSKIRPGDIVWVADAKIYQVSVSGVIESVESPDVTRISPDEFRKLGVI